MNSIQWIKKSIKIEKIKMKILKIFIPVTLLFLLTLSTGCGRRSENTGISTQDSTNEKQSHLSEGKDSYDLSMMIIQKVTSITETGTTISENHFTYPARYSIVGKQNNGGFIMSRLPLEFIYSYFDLSTGEQKASFDSRKDPVTNLPASLWTQYAEIGIEFTVEIDSAGNVISLHDTDSIFSVMNKKGRDLFGSENTGENSAFYSQLKTNYSDKETITKKVSSYFESCSLKDLKAGESRTVKSPVQLNTYYIESVYTCLQDTGNTLKLDYSNRQIQIDTNPDLSVDGASDAQNENLSKFRYQNIEGEAEGTIYIFKDTGWVYKGTIDSFHSYDLLHEDYKTNKMITSTIVYELHTEYEPYNPEKNYLNAMKSLSERL
jgi:hypothetical protein